ncbi:MAG: ABC transporter ATP-binding protein [Pigmentiphaga sp.]|uniref:ABC transporter ATP-binding protein n=1 Tax=Pigmentiphaga sp. TaxID=1977564 RepID=UPI003B57EF4B
MSAVLEVQGLSKTFGALKVIEDFSIRLVEGERRLILGPNGAGKTTLFNMISGDIRQSAGSICLFGEDVSFLPTARRSARGVARTYQILTLFPHDTLVHNVKLALLGKRPQRWNPFLNLDAMPELEDRAMAVLGQVGLAALAKSPLVRTSYGEKRRLEIALALAQEPRLLLLDEPLAGLSSEERLQMQQLLEAIPRSITVVMIEHDMDVALSFADRISLLHHGRLVIEGTRQEVASHPRTREVYLGH